MVTFYPVRKTLNISADQILGLQSPPPAPPHAHLKSCIAQFLRWRTTCGVELNRLMEKMTGEISFKSNRKKAIEIVREWVKDHSPDKDGEKRG